MERLLTDKETAKALSLSVQTLRNWRVSGKGPPYVKLGGAVRYREGDLLEWVDGGRVDPVVKSAV